MTLVAPMAENPSRRGDSGKITNRFPETGFDFFHPKDSTVAPEEMATRHF